MFAIVTIAGKQFKVAQGDVLEVPKLKDNKVGDKVKIDQVLMKSDGKKTEIGTPFISGSHVELIVKEYGRGEKIRVYKKNPKKRYEKTIGHRTYYTMVEVTAVK
jgi:large subunit ribosomal protein L21